LIFHQISCGFIKIEDGISQLLLGASPDQDTLIATRKYTDSNAGKVGFENEAFVISYT
jgi:hypothetical protein